MNPLIRALAAAALLAGAAGCGMLNRSPVPEPITPIQKATASPDNPDSAILADFKARLEKYVRVQRALLDKVPISENATPAQIRARQETLAAQLRMIRKDAKPGDILTPQVAALFRRLINPELKGREGRDTKRALEEDDGTRAHVWLRVNATWPESEPLTTMPPNILANLPQLPEDVEYLITDERHLLLRDVDANIIVDFIYHAVR